MNLIKIIAKDKGFPLKMRLNLIILLTTVSINKKRRWSKILRVSNRQYNITGQFKKESPTEKREGAKKTSDDTDNDDKYTETVRQLVISASKFRITKHMKSSYTWVFFTSL